MSDLNELAAALAKAQGEIMPAPKDADNPFFKSKYASLPAIREAIRDPFSVNGLSVVQMPEVTDGQLKLRTLLLHSSGQTLDCGTLSAEVDLANPQKIGSAITYFRRYALAAISQTVADEDDDAQAASQKRPAPKLTAKESAYVDDALAEIAACDDFKFLADMGAKIRQHSAAVQNKLRPKYTARYNKLKPLAAAADVGDAPPY